jgi:Xaa-Pro aminopeptidase
MMFEKEIYTERRKQLKLRFQSGKLLFLGNEECGSLSDFYKTLRQSDRQLVSYIYAFGRNVPDHSGSIC